MDYSISHAAFQNSLRTNSCYGSESYWRARDGSTDSHTEWSWKTGSDPIGSQARSRRYVWKFPMGSRDARDVAAPFRDQSQTRLGENRTRTGLASLFS